MTDRPNVVLLSADALRADHLSCYGYSRTTSPVIDGFASDNTRFARTFSASSHTREAVPALLTGSYPDVAVDSGYRLATESIAESLSEGGFRTAGFHSNPFVSRAYGFDRGFDHFDDDLHFGKHKLIALAQRALDKLRNRHYARASEINDRSLSWLDSLDGDPFFLWNHYMDTHGPYEPPNEYRKYGGYDISGREAQSLYQRAIRDPDSVSDEERRTLIDLYDAEIRYNDEKIGEFLDALASRNLLDESLVIITADHGDAFGEHGYYEHPRHLHAEITHVPLVIRPPGGGEGDVVETPTSTLDVAATIAEAVDARGEWTGRSLFDPPDTRTVFSQARGEDEHSHIRRYAARSTDASCFCERDGESGALNFTESSDRSLCGELEEYVEQRVGIQSADSEGSDEDVDEEIERRLSALGYKE